MEVSDGLLERNIFGGFGVSLILVASLFVTIYHKTALFPETNDWVEHTHEVLRRADKIKSEVENVEVNAHGYVASGSAIFLDDYKSSIQKIDNDLESLKELTVDNPHQQKRISDISAQIKSSPVFSAASLAEEAQRRENVRNFQDVAASDKKNIAGIIRIIDDINQEENALLKERRDRFIEAEYHARLALFASSLAVLFLFVISYLYIRRALKTRRRANLEIRRREELYRTLVRAIPKIGVILFDRNMRYSLAEGEELEAGGFAREKIEGKTLNEVFPSEIVEEWVDYYRRALGGERIVLETQTNGKHYKTYILPVHNSAGKIFAGMVMWKDITEHRLFEQELRQSEARYRDLFDKSLGFICSHDLNGKLLSINPAAAKALNYEVEEMVGKSMEEFLQSEQKVHFHKFLTAISENSKITGNMLVQSRTGEKFIWRFDSAVYSDPGQAPYVVGYAQDVTQIEETGRRLAQITEEVRTANYRLQGILESTDDLIAAIDNDSRIIGFNKVYQASFEQFYGKTPYTGMTISETYSNLDASKMKSVGEWQRTLQGENFVEYREINLPGEEPVYFEIYYNPIRDSAGNQIGATQFARNVTKRHRMETEIKAARDEALKSTRLKSEFLANMSHEIRTPMNGVIGMTELLLDTKLDAEQRDYAETVKSSGAALLTIINDILDFSKIEAGKLHFETIDFDARQVINSVVEVFAATAEQKKLRLISEICEDTPTALRGDPGRLRQILTNLIGNALKFTERGTINVRVKTLSETDTETTLHFSVTDTGIGISEEASRNLFQPFVQADGSMTRRYGGTGLGLAISKQLVSLMNGAMNVESVSGEGSTFWFTVTLEKQRFTRQVPAFAVAPNNYNARRQTENQLKKCLIQEEIAQKKDHYAILVAEDNPVNQKVIRRQIENLGFTADIVNNGQEALAAFLNKSYSLILMDCQMPLMDGYTTTSEIRQRENDRHIPIIALTASAIQGDREKCLAAGMDDYLSKPTNQQAIGEVINKFLEIDSPNSNL